MPSAFSVVAIIAAYNEADIVGTVVGDLIAQGVQVYFLDDGSTDGTVAAVEPFLGHGVLQIERLGDLPDAVPERFDWEGILQRKARLAAELEATWFIHHDADEFRESPWAQLSLKDAIEQVDAAGYNAIDFGGLDFWPTHDGFTAGDDVREAFPFYTPSEPYDHVQVRCWKKTGQAIDLASSGGHEAQFPGRLVFPVRFILRHYPIRGQSHGERKVFHERRSRFAAEERERGWHVQYENFHEGTSFIRDAASLTRYDGDALRVALTVRHRGVEDLERTAEDRRRKALQCREELARLRDELEVATSMLEEERRRLAERQAALDVQSAEVRGLGDAVKQRTAEIEQWRASVDGLERRIQDLEQSLSWRWTAPARAVGRLLKGPRS